MSNSITPAQRATILSIELKLGEVFTGTTKKKASQFINLHWDRLVSTPSKQRAPSKEQIIKIERLEEVGCPDFTDNTYKSASDYIYHNAPLANNIKEYWGSYQ